MNWKKFTAVVITGAVLGVLTEYVIRPVVTGPIEKKIEESVEK